MKEIKLNKLKETIYFDTCDNGLEIYMWVNEKTDNYYATLNVKYGSLDTKFKVKDKVIELENGIAHFLEHINFNESDNICANEYFDKKGTATNAFTTYDYTSYMIYGSNDIFGDVSHLLDFVQDKCINEKQVEKEKGIIIEEYNMGLNNPNQKFYFERLKAIYNQNRKRNEITGNKKDIESINAKNLNLVFDYFYQPSNCFIVITGNFNPYEMSALIKENQSKKKFKKIDVKKIYDKEDLKVHNDYLEIEGNVNIPKLSISYKMNRKKFKDYNDVLLNLYLNIILNANFGPTSTLKQDLLEKGLISYMNAYKSIDKDSVVISIIVESKYPNEIISILREYVNKLTITEYNF